MKKLMALLLCVLLCGCVPVLGEEAGVEKIYAGIYTFTLPDGVTAEPESITEGVHGFVAKGDAYEIIGVTIDYEKHADLKRALEEGNNAQEAHMKIALNMIILEEQMPEQLEIITDSSDKLLSWANFTIGDVNIFIYSKCENATGYLVMLAWQQEKPTFNEQQKRQELIRDVAASGTHTTLRVRIINDEAQLWKEPRIGGATWGTVKASDHFPCEGETGEFFIIDYNGNTAYVHKTNAKLE